LFISLPRVTVLVALVRVFHDQRLVVFQQLFGSGKAVRLAVSIPLGPEYFSPPATVWRGSSAVQVQEPRHPSSFIAAMGRSSLAIVIHATEFIGQVGTEWTK